MTTRNSIMLALALALAIFSCTLSADAFSVPSSIGTFRHGASLTKLNAVAKSREAEFAKLVDKLGVSQDKVRDLLVSQRSRLKGTEARAKHIDWLLEDNGDDDGQVNKKRAKKSGGAKKNGHQSAAASGVKREVGPARPAAPATAKKSPPIKTTNNGESKDESLLTNVEFASRDDLHQNTKRALSQTLGLTSMTEIQARTYDAALSGKDVLGRARTGTGKTIAFLLPAIERILRSEEYDEENDVGILVISPTRELAMQIGDEAEKLLTFHRSMSVQVVYGGTKTTRDVARFKTRLPTVLVATPGRLKDLLQTASIGGTKFSNIMSRTPLVVLDETDSLLEQGFRREILAILKFLPNSNKRQTLLFSATVPKELKEIMAQVMKKDFIEVDCIQDGGKGEESTQTHIHVEQSHAIIPSTAQYVPSIVRVVKEAVKGDGTHKVIVFFPTARMVSFFADLFNEVVRVPVMELHSKKSQNYRNRVSAQFREATEGILFTSDVSARGVDYPGVSHVIQFGMPSSREQYVHRLGRTGRGGASGKGWLVLGPFESMFLEELKNIKVPKNPDVIDLLNKSELDDTDDLMEVLLEKIQSRDEVLVKSGEGAYQAFLGYYLGQMKRMKMNRKERLVDVANEFSRSMGFRESPTLGTNMVKKMGLAGVAGLSVSASKNKTGNSNVRRGAPQAKERRSKPRHRDR